MPLKKRSTLFTTEMIEAARENQKLYPWAKKMAEQTIKEADEILKIGYERAVELMPSTQLRRSYQINDHDGCPICGMKNYTAGNNYNWSYENPWKLVCPTCQNTFPANDFESYYKSGLDQYGNFHYELADDTLLVNTLYPDKPADHFVDNGLGMTNEENIFYVVIAHCANNMWSHAHNLIRTLRTAYLYTGEQKYADLAIVMLSRLADVYPDMNVDYEVENKSFISCNGGSAGEGKILGRISETYISLEFSRAYDALFTAFPNLSEDALSFIKSRSPLPIEDYSDVMVNIEDRVIKEIYHGIKAGKNHGNMGMHQATLANAAKCFDSIDCSREWLDFVFQDGNGTTTGGNLNNILISVVDRDGFGNEAAPAYNIGWLEGFLDIADILNDYYINGTDISYDMYKNPKFKKMFLGYTKLVLSDKYTPHVGDTQFTGSASRFDRTPNLIRAFSVYGDKIFAQALHYAIKDNISTLNTGIFSKNPEKIQQDIIDAIDKYGSISNPSFILNGYGMAALKNRSEKYTAKHPVDTTAAVFFGRNFGHGHSDSLNLYLYSHHVDVTPDHGTPEYKNATNPHRYQVVITTLSHNTVVVDEFSQNNRVVVGTTRHFAVGDTVQLVDVESHAYSQCPLYARTVATVKISDTQTYALDFFRVKGGSQHKYSFHTMPPVNIETQGLHLEKQVDENGEYIGTYAGKDIPFGTVEYNGETLHKSRGYQWYTEVNKDTNPNEKISIDWTIQDHYNLAENLQGDLHLKLTTLGKHDEVALLKGVPPRKYAQNPRSLSYLFITNNGEDLGSAFVTALEPYDSADGCQITDISPLSITKDGKTVDSYLINAVKVTLKNGRVDYIVCSYDKESTYRIGDLFDFCGYFGYYSEDKGQIRTWMHDASRLGNVTTTDALSGKVLHFTKELSIQNYITVSFDSKDVTPDMLIGNYLKCKTTEVDCNPFYEIISAVKNDDNTFTLDIGDITLIQKYSDEKNDCSLYDYNLSENQTFTIAQTFSHDLSK